MISLCSTVAVLLLSFFSIPQDDGQSSQYDVASQRLLTTQELSKFSSRELVIMRSTIYARHGFIFKSRDLREYFSHRPWYRPIRTDVDYLLTNVERANLELIKQQEVVAANKTVTVVTSSPASEERCYSSTNSRGQQFRLHISIGGDGNPTSVRYRDKSTSIPLSYHGREVIHVPEFNTSIYAKTYTETHNGRTTGKVYFLERRLSNGVGVVFERTSDGQFFYYADCSSTSPTEQRASTSNTVEAQAPARVNDSNPEPAPTAAAKTTEARPAAKRESTTNKIVRRSLNLNLDNRPGAAGRKP
jgi:hypothetical protein